MGQRDPRISVYAELLPHIRRVSLAVSLPGPAAGGGGGGGGGATSVALVDGASRVRVRHGGAEVVARLPARVAAQTAGAVQLPLEEGRTEGSWRLPAAPAAGPGAEAAVPPWEAREVGASGGGVRCRGCGGGAAVVPAGRVPEWLDLPSENWAEMMEFWHCHKPGDHHGHGHGRDDEHGREGLPAPGDGGGAGAGAGRDGEKKTQAQLASRGYGADSAIAARKGTGFVDLMTVLLAEEDCDGVLYSWTDPQEGRTGTAGLAEPPTPGSGTPVTPGVFCAACRARLGYFNFRTSAVTLFKWQIALAGAGAGAGSPDLPATARAPRAAHFVAAALVATLARTGSARTLLMPMFDARPADAAAGRAGPRRVLHVWLLNGNIRYTHAGPRPGPQPGAGGAVPAVKVLWRTLGIEEAERMLESFPGAAAGGGGDVQEVNLPPEALGEVERELGDSNGLLPRGERAFKGIWNVGLLERWEEGV